MRKINWKKVIGWGTAALVLIGIIGTNIYQMRDVKSDKTVIKIGVTLPLTGALARLGSQTKKAIELRISEIPSDSKYHYQMIFEDDQLQPSKEFTNAQKLINFNKVDVMISGFSGGATAIAGLANQKKIVYWHFQWTDDITKTSPYVFAYNQMPKDVASLWLKTAYDKGIRKIAIINNETHAGGEYVISAIKKLLPSYPDMQIVSIERVPLFGSDLRTTLLKMNSKKPEIYLSVLLSPTMDEFAEKMKEQGILVPISSINRFEYAKNKELIEGNWAVGANDYNEEMLIHYQEKYNEKVTTEMPSYAYDVTDITVKTYENSEHKLTGEELAIELMKMKEYHGGFGPVELDENGVFHTPLIVGKIQGGKFVPLEKGEKK